VVEFSEIFDGCGVSIAHALRSDRTRGVFRQKGVRPECFDTALVRKDLIERNNFVSHLDAFAREFLEGATIDDAPETAVAHIHAG
jgi:hypothetical protein